MELQHERAPQACFAPDQPGGGRGKLTLAISRAISLCDFLWAHFDLAQKPWRAAG
jgi:hypothetical protein